AKRAIDGVQIGYTDAGGLPELRQRLAETYRTLYGVSLEPERVMVTNGSSAGFIVAFLSAFDLGDRVALAAPGYPAYRNI
ncbi:aminotransferase class I/II-fold pyridoxal phosphate-dependent enzyme, partial [Tritonibacter sp. SIMBA_163]|uniref:aminotransferase class I/II-fold pyridoxal phosphate-dependent enzyme n=1 Tax=Tritonibacter sp. SIMBA_163 TaxID=3080868 RepID=UPI003980E5F5